MDSIRSALLALTLGIMITGPVSADVLLMDSIKEAPPMETPRAGMSMDSVRARYGDPVREYPTVSTDGGPLQPPITRWDYDGYSVFFEHNLVVHSVTHHAGKQ
jgi:hypothetical protein